MDDHVDDLTTVEPETRAQVAFAAAGGVVARWRDGRRYGWVEDGRYNRIVAFDGEGGAPREIGGSVTLEGVHKIVSDEATGESARRAAAWHAWFEGKTRASRPHDVMVAAGYAGVHTGGGCTGWEKALDDGTSILITSDADMDGDPEAPEWAVGRYGPEGGFVALNGEMTLREALAAGPLLPSPVRDGAEVQESYDTVGEAVAAVGAEDAGPRP